MFRNICIKDFKENVFDLIGQESMLITAGGKDNCNTMTASWGFLGEMWNKECVSVVVRPQRYTNEFLTNNEYFTLCFFGKDERAKEIYKLCGTVSGKEVNKIEKLGLTAMGNEKVAYFGEARLIIVCKKLYCAQLQEECFTQKEIAEKNYPQKDYHYQYIASVERIYVKEEDQ